MTREEWLEAFTHEVQGRFVQMGHPLPPVRLTCGWPLSGGRPGAKRQTIGQCFAPSVSSAGRTEIFISPVLDDSMKVAEVTLHELAHAAVGVQHGHRKPFIRAIRLLDLGGKPTATVPTPEMELWVMPIIDKIGEYPHAAMNLSQVKKQTTRMIKVECAECAYDDDPYIVRMSQKQIDAKGCPICPVHEIAMHAA